MPPGTHRATFPPTPSRATLQNKKTHSDLKKKDTAMTTSPLESLLSLDFNNPLHLVLVLAILGILVWSVQAIYKEIRRIVRKGRRRIGKLSAAGVVAAGSGGALTDAFGIPSDIIDHLGLATLLL